MSITLKMVDGDLATDSGGRYLNVVGAEKAAQDIAEVLMNNYDPEFPPYWIGSSLFEIQANPTEFNTFNAELSIRSSVEDAVARLQDLQDVDPFVDDEERITHIKRLEVIQIGDKSYAFFLEVRVDSDELLQLEFDVPLGQVLPPSFSGNIDQTTNILDETSKLFL
jgi:hypothetical protein